MSGPSLKHTEPTRPINRDRHRTISPADAHIHAAAELGWRNGWCPTCGTQAYLFGASLKALVEEREASNGHGPMSGQTDANEPSAFCALCDLLHRPSRRRHAILNGYIWYLILAEDGPEASPQYLINRSLWAAANGAIQTSRELRRAELRRRLAQAMDGKAYQEASIVLAKDGMDQVVFSHLESILPDGMMRTIRDDPPHQRAVMGTLGMDFLLRQAEAGTLTPSWRGRERYFLTDRGLETLANGLPLGMSIREDPASPGKALAG